MKPFRDMPIKQKLMVIIMSITTAALLISGLGVVVADSFLFRKSMQRDISALAQIVADNSTAALDFDDPNAAGQTLSSLRARPHFLLACIYRADHRVFASYLRPGSNAACPAADTPDEIRFTSSTLLIRQPILVRGVRTGTLVLVSDLGELSESLQLYGRTVLIVLIVSGLVAFILSSSLRALIAAPVSHLAQLMRSVSETHDYSLRAREVTSDELGSLAEGFNQMLERIQSQDSELRKALKAQEAALLETQRIRDSLRTTLASIGDAVISTDTAGRVVFINEIARALLKMTQEEIVGSPLDQVFVAVNEFSRRRVESPVAQVLREGRIIGMANHTVLIAHDGSEIPIDDSGAPIRDEDGRIQGTVLVFRDVTPRRRADETSRLLAQIVQSTDDAVFSNDLQGRVLSWNRAAERMFGFSAQEMIGRLVSELAPPDKQAEIAAMLESVGRGESVEHHETVRRTANGELLTVSERSSPLQDPVGRILGASTISRDVTEQVRAGARLARLNQDLRRSNETLAMTNQDLERFAFIASHDLQEPLRMITAYSQLLVKSYRGQFDEEAKGFVDTIAEGTRRMRELLADLLAYTEIRAREEEDPEIVDLNTVIQNVLQNLQAAIDETHAVVTSDRLPNVHAHGSHFQSLFQNLVGNAIKYHADQPPRIHISVEEVDGELRFAVSDNGIGIAPEYHAKIFEVFRRLHSKKISGTGVGLAICQRVVERYGGRIWVESNVGQGAKFLFALPNIAVHAAGESK